jgi:hypothetical protein
MAGWVAEMSAHVPNVHTTSEDPLVDRGHKHTLLIFSVGGFSELRPKTEFSEVRQDE